VTAFILRRWIGEWGKKNIEDTNPWLNTRKGAYPCEVEEFSKKASIKGGDFCPEAIDINIQKKNRSNFSGGEITKN